MKTITLAGILLLLCFVSIIRLDAQTEYRIKPRDTDPQIGLPLSIYNVLDDHFVCLAPHAPTRSLLYLFLPGTGGKPEQYTAITKQAARDGFHAICLSYPDRYTVETTICIDSPDSNCMGNAKHEILEGSNYSADVDVNRANSVENRAIKLLQYLNKQHPQDGWEQYLNNGELVWEKIVIAGHSQGGGIAAYAAKLHRVARVCMFAAPRDYSTYFSAPAAWLSSPQNATPVERYYGLSHEKDIKVIQEKIWDAMGLATAANSTSVDNNVPPYNNKRLLFTNMEPNGGSGGLNAHLSVAVDSFVPVRNDTLLLSDAWSYLSGVSFATDVSEKPEVQDVDGLLFPQPANSIVFFSLPSSLVSIGNTYSLRVVDTMGKEILHMPDYTALQLNRLEVNNLTAGLYFLYLQTAGKSLTKAFYINR